MIARLGVGASKGDSVIAERLSKADSKYRAVLSKHRPTQGELTTFYTEVARVFEAKGTTAPALIIAIKLAQTPRFRGVLASILYLMTDQGVSLPIAMAEFPAYFNKITIAMVEAGDRSGTLADTFRRLATTAVSSQSQIKKVNKAILQPLIHLGMLVVALIILHFTTFPIYRENYAAMHVDLPLPTKIVLGVDGIFWNHPITWILPIGGAFWVYYRRKEIAATDRFQRFVLRIPFIGRLLRKSIIARSMRTLVILRGERVQTDLMYAMVAESTGNVVYREYFQAIARHQEAGQKIHHSFLLERWRIGIDGDELASRLEAAEMTGQEEETLQEAARICEEQAESLADTLPQFINPICIIALTGLISVIMLAVFLPNFVLAIKALNGNFR
jgi:type II secretory pathway component PulF